jgi:hypothetical protein
VNKHGLKINVLIRKDRDFEYMIRNFENWKLYEDLKPIRYIRKFRSLMNAVYDIFQHNTIKFKHTKAVFN